MMTMSLVMIILALFINFNIFKKIFFISNFMFLLGFMYLMNLSNFNEWYMISMLMGINYYSFGLILLSFWIMGLVMMSLIKEKNMILLMNLLMIMLMVMLMNFLSMNILFYYLMFEISLLMIFFMLIKWGLGVMRLVAGYYLMFYTLFFSLPLMLILFYLMNMFGSDNFLEMEWIDYSMVNEMMMMFMLGSFLVKLPMYTLHLWLLKAHVEAPVYGSMILAALMLKLGSYGMLRFMLIFYEKFMNFDFCIFFGFLGGIILSMLCFRQIDMKILVAMSSVVHMSLLLSAMFTMFKLGLLGSYIMMVAHGLCSSGMFYMLNLCYIESNSRMLMFNKGLMSIMPSMTLMWFLLCSSNMAAPFSLNLVGEIFMLMSLMMWSKLLIFFMFIYCLLSFMYSLYLFSYINHGNLNLNLFMESKMINYLILLFHWMPLNLIIFNMDLIV